MAGAGVRLTGPGACIRGAGRAPRRWTRKRNAGGRAWRPRRRRDRANGEPRRWPGARRWCVCSRPAISLERCRTRMMSPMIRSSSATVMSRPASVRMARWKLHVDLDVRGDVAFLDRRRLACHEVVEPQAIPLREGRSGEPNAGALQGCANEAALAKPCSIDQRHRSSDMRNGRDQALCRQSTDGIADRASARRRGCPRGHAR